jgi:hypothetical protein
MSETPGMFTKAEKDARRELVCKVVYGESLVARHTSKYRYVDVDIVHLRDGCR